MSDKPSYLGLLNGIAVAESQAHRYLTAWIEACTKPDVKAVLTKVALREGEHGLSFAKRVNELGYSVRQRDDGGRFAEQLAMAGSGISDLEKMRALGLERLETDVLGFFDNVFSDHSIDIQTGALLGRYIAEEFDTARLLRSCYEQLAAAEEGARAGGGQTPVDPQVGALASRVDELCAAVEDLREMVAANAAPARHSNGKATGAATRRTRRA